MIVPVTSYVAKFEFSATTTSRLKSPMGPATDRFEPKNAFRTKQIRDFAWPVPQTDGEVRQGPKIGANSIARRSNLSNWVDLNPVTSHFGVTASHQSGSPAL